MKTRYFLLCVLLALFAVPVSGQIVVKEFTACADLEINQHVNYNKTNLGSKESIAVKSYGDQYKNPVTDPQVHGLFRWDLKEIPAGMRIVNAAVRIQQCDAATGKVRLYSVDTVGWDEQKTTWTSYYKNVPRETLLGEMVNKPVAQGATSFSSKALIDAVQRWYSKPASNYGIIVKWNGPKGQGDNYLTREKESQYIKPTLVVAYEPVSAGNSAAAVKRSGDESVLKGYTGQTFAVMDLDYDLMSYVHTRDTMRRKMQLLAQCGFKRIYILAIPPVGADYAIPAYPGRKGIHRDECYANMDGNPLKYAVQYAKEAGMETIVQFKPYEGGGIFTVPHGFVPPCDRNWLETLGGRAVGVDNFFIKHPDMRPKRRQYDKHADKAVDKLELVFNLDLIPGRPGLKKVNEVMTVVPRPDTPAWTEKDIRSNPLGIITLFTSQDNAAYVKYAGDLQISERIEKRLIRDANGELLSRMPQLCRVVTLSGLNLDAPYFAVQIDGDAVKYKMIPFSESFISAFAADGTRLPVTSTVNVRAGTLTRKYGFQQNGFDFNVIGPYYWTDGWKDVNLLGIARGKEEYIRGTFCEAYPEVREYWMKQIREFMDMGCDGVDIRLMCHSGAMSDFVNYGYNEPIVRKYRELYGNVAEADMDHWKIMKIRGDFFLEFAREASELLHKNGKRFSVHMHDFLGRPTLDPTFPSFGFWTQPKILPDMDRLIELVDDVVIKDYYWGVYDPLRALHIKEAAEKAGKPFYLHAYLQQGHDINAKFLADAEKDPLVDGLMIYEVVWRPAEFDGMVNVTEDDAVELVPQSYFYKQLKKIPEAIPAGK